MRVAVLGTGVVGQAHAAKLSELGYEVAVGTRNPKESLARSQSGQMAEAFGAWAKKHPEIQVVTMAEAAAQAEIVFEALSGKAVVDALKPLAKELEGKVLIDISNGLDFVEGELRLTVGSHESLGEKIQSALPDVQVVKAFNTTNANVQIDPRSVAGGDHHLFIAGNDAAAKKQVGKIAQEYGWQNILDLGDIKSARGMEMILPIWIKIMGTVGTSKFNFKIAR
jgi:8-hydroxy-5-deazaflavin:NADPH oxidoreductase